VTEARRSGGLVVDEGRDYVALLTSITKTLSAQVHLRKKIMASILVVVTFLAGSTWGPVITMTPTVNAESCGALKWEIARQITNTARTNVQGGASISKQDDDLLVVAGSQGTREMARLSCKQA